MTDQANTTPDLAQRLVQVAAEAIAAERHAGPPHLSDEEWAEVAIVAVLRELPGHPESGRREHGRYWTPEALRDLADDIEGANRV
jgi:hypothetical protein